MALVYPSNSFRKARTPNSPSNLGWLRLRLTRPIHRTIPFAAPSNEMRKQPLLRDCMTIRQASPACETENLTIIGEHVSLSLEKSRQFVAAFQEFRRIHEIQTSIFLHKSSTLSAVKSSSLINDIYIYSIPEYQRYC